MDKLAFAVYDEKTKCHLQPFFLNTLAEAIRAITDVVNQKGHNFNLHPQDYTLFQIGIFNQETGIFTSEYQVIDNLVKYKKSPLVDLDLLEALELFNNYFDNQNPSNEKVRQIK